jgi:transposase
MELLFCKGRDLAAWIGMVLRECPAGGKQKLLGISKRGIRTYESSSSKVHAVWCNSDTSKLPV